MSRIFPDGIGRLAQLVEHLVYTERVGSSSLSSPTSILRRKSIREMDLAKMLPSKAREEAKSDLLQYFVNQPSSLGARPVEIAGNPPDFAPAGIVKHADRKHSPELLV